MIFYKKNLMTALVLFIVLILGGAKAFIDDQFNVSLESWLNSISPVAGEYHAKYATASFSLLGSAVVSKLQLTNGHKTFEVDQLILKKAYQLYRLDSLPQHLRLILYNVRWTVDEGEAIVSILMTLLGYSSYSVYLKDLSQLGYSQATIYLNADLEEGDWHLSILIAEMTGNELSITAKARCVRCSLAQISRVPLALDLTEMVVNYSDKGLMKKIFDLLAQRQQMTLTTFKQTLITRLHQDLQQPLLVMDAQTLESLRQFIESPENLSIQLQIIPPLAIKQLKMMNLGKSRFHLKIATQSVIN